MDTNGHMANTAYLDLAADVRMAFFAEHGFPPSELRKLPIGPVMRKDEVEYFREIGLHETVTVTYALLAMSAGRQGITVVTANRRDFARLAKLRPFSWQLASDSAN